MIGTRILKFDSEIAEIIEVKVGNHQKNNFHVEDGNFDQNYLSYFWIEFHNSCANHVANFPNFLKIQEIYYMIGTRILKIDLEIAEIIEFKVANFSIEIIFLPLCNSKLSISKWWLPTLTSIISAISKSIFKNIVPICPS